MITVLATREGLQGRKMATGLPVDDHVPFVALPSTHALRLWVRLRNPRNNKSCKALVLDVGPWNTGDHSYVFQAATMGPQLATPVRPQSETGEDLMGRPTNHAGIDLGEWVWQALGMTDNDQIQWEFIL